MNLLYFRLHLTLQRLDVSTTVTINASVQPFGSFYYHIAAHASSPYIHPLLHHERVREQPAVGAPGQQLPRPGPGDAEHLKE